MAEMLIEMGRNGCPRGKVLRDPYTRKDGVRVRAACIPHKSRFPGKAPAYAKFMPDMGPNPLKGWHKDLAASTRHEKLRKLTKSVGCKDALARVRVIANVTKDKSTQTKLRTDYRWLREQSFCHLKSKNGK